MLLDFMCWASVAIVVGAGVGVPLLLVYGIYKADKSYDQAVREKQA